MNKLIKTLSLTSLLYTLAHSMEKNAIIPAPSKPFTMNNVVIPNDILKQIFKYSCSNEARLKRETIHIANKIRFVCTHFYTTFNPTAIRQLLDWKPQDMVENLYSLICACDPYAEREKVLRSVHEYCHIQLLHIQRLLSRNPNKHYFCDDSSFCDVCTNVTKYHRFTFFVDALKDQPNLYNGPLHQAIQRNLPIYTRILLEKGANQKNLKTGTYKKYLRMVKMILPKEDHLLSRHQKQIDTYLKLTKSKKTKYLTLFAACLTPLIAISLVFIQYVLP